MRNDVGIRLSRSGGWWRLAAALALAGCGGARTPGSSAADGTASIWTELAPSTLDATGGRADDPGGQGAPGGNFAVVTTGPLSFGASFAASADVPSPPADAQRIASLDADVSVTGTAVVDGAVAARGHRLSVSGGDLFITGSLRSDGDLTLEAPDGAIYVTGTVDSSGSDLGQHGGAVSMAAARLLVTGTITTQGGPDAGRAGDIQMSADGDVTLLGTLRGRGGALSASSAGARAGDAATLAIDAGGHVQLAGVVDLRGGPASGKRADRVASGGAGGHVTIGASRPPASVAFALDVSLDGGSGHDLGGAGGRVTLVAGGDFTVTGAVRSRGGSIAAGGSGDGGLAGDLTMDINTMLGDQIYRPGGTIVLDGGSSGGEGTAGGGGHLYARSFDGIVTMSGTLSARGGDARDPGGTGGLGGHVNIFSDNDFNGIGGNLTITPEGVIDVSGGAGTTGGSARNDGTTNVADFPVNQEQIAVLLNADGVNGRPTDGVIDNQGLIVARGGAESGAGGDVAFHGEGVNHLHDPLSGRLDLGGNGSGADGQFAGL